MGKLDLCLRHDLPNGKNSRMRPACPTVRTISRGMQDGLGTSPHTSGRVVLLCIRARKRAVFCDLLILKYVLEDTYRERPLQTDVMR